MARMALASISSIWQRICAGLRDELPKEYLISPGLSEKQIRKAEQTIGNPLPADLREFYAAQNGIPGIEFIVDQNIGFCLPLVAPKKPRPPLGKCNVVESWSFFKKNSPSAFIEDRWIDPKGSIRKTAWTTEWIPIFDNQQGDYVFADLNPPPRGTHGQLIEWWRSDGPKRILFRSFREFLTRIAEDLSRKRLVIVPGNFAVLLAKKSTWKKMQAQSEPG